MAIDVHRSDLGRVAVPGSVRVLGEPRVLAGRTVWSRVAEVVARRAPGTTLDEVVRAVLPCGSVTGAPKVRAMEVIARLEPWRRGRYTGRSGGWAATGARARDGDSHAGARESRPGARPPRGADAADAPTRRRGRRERATSRGAASWPTACRSASSRRRAGRQLQLEGLARSQMPAGAPGFGAYVPSLPMSLAERSAPPSPCARVDGLQAASWPTRARRRSDLGRRAPEARRARRPGDERRDGAGQARRQAAARDRRGARHARSPGATSSRAPRSPGPGS